ncbi:hypothetical protein [Pedobacter sp. SL55]|uniref:hypothetical protein n=1 Tax=Pedobacter sp. SL55 TaxID=2995161 RepID=UPI00226EA536|nr:hypothetical protein [Pedobacter sp. SL55]WAC41403.1 hypothetical protein OVA16_03290 [Pedobacter sp. SL55]
MNKENLLSRAEMKKVMGGYDVSVQCTYHFWNGTTESGNVTVPGGYGGNSQYAFAHLYAEDFCANDPSCAFVDCGH